MPNFCMDLNWACELPDLHASTLQPDLVAGYPQFSAQRTPESWGYHPSNPLTAAKFQGNLWSASLLERCFSCMLHLWICTGPWSARVCRRHDLRSHQELPHARHPKPQESSEESLRNPTKSVFQIESNLGGLRLFKALWDKWSLYIPATLDSQSILQPPHSGNCPTLGSSMAMATTAQASRQAGHQSAQVRQIGVNDAMTTGDCSTVPSYFTRTNLGAGAFTGPAPLWKP